MKRLKRSPLVYSMTSKGSSRTSQNKLLLQTLLKYYRNNNALDDVLDIINGESEISLRAVDWFATNYSKQNFICLKKNGTSVNVYTDYKLNLRSYSKRRFDPFCRWDRITIPYKDGKHIQTTLGQLNFFRWAITTGVIDYIREHLAEIEADMNQRNSTSRRKAKVSANKGNGTRKRREELSMYAGKSVHRTHVEITVRFD